MSGFVRLSIVGPSELYGSVAPVDQHGAPTVNANGELAGSGMLPAAVWYWRGVPSPVTKRSKRGWGSAAA